MPRANALRIDTDQVNIDKFVKRIQKHVLRITPKACWETAGCCTSSEYHQIRVQGKMYLAHRLMYAVLKGPIPKGILVCHTCDNPCCINPEHLFLGTYQDNSDDKINKNRQAAGEQHGRTLLTDSVVLNIFDARGSQRKIAKQFCVSQTQVCRIKARTIWKQLLDMHRPLD